MLNGGLDGSEILSGHVHASNALDSQWKCGVLLKIAQHGGLVGEGIFQGDHLLVGHGVQLVEILVKVLNIFLNLGQSVLELGFLGRQGIKVIGVIGCAGLGMKQFSRGSAN